MKRLGFALATLAVSLPLAAQRPPAGDRRLAGPGAPGARPFAQGPGAQRPLGPPPERIFILGQAMRGIDEKVSILLEQGKTEAAIEEMKKVYALDVPRMHPVYEAKAHLIGRLAVTYANAGRKKEAVETIQRLLADVPPDTVAEATAWLEAGSVYKQAGMADEALKAFDRAIELSQKLAKAPPRGPAGAPPMPPPQGPGAAQPPR